MDGLRIIRPGLQTTIQDRGRWGWQAFGVPVAGPMDPRSHRLANALVGNGVDDAALEVTLLGPEIEFEVGRCVAVSGAVFELTVDNREVAGRGVFDVQAGSRLCFGRRVSGARAYVAISGGVDVVPVLGSRSTHLVSRMGGLDGRALVAGDRLSLGPAESGRQGQRHGEPAVEVMLPDIVGPGRPARVRVVAGTEPDLFADDALRVLQSAPYAVGVDSDRMGFRLDGPILRHRGLAEIISDATPLGVIQVPSSGRPVLLMADRQTAGGYPKIATVITADLPVVGQLAPGDTVLFEMCTRQAALQALIADERALMALEGRLGREDPPGHAS